MKNKPIKHIDCYEDILEDVYGIKIVKNKECVCYTSTQTKENLERDLSSYIPNNSNKKNKYSQNTSYRNDYGYEQEENEDEDDYTYGNGFLTPFDMYKVDVAYDPDNWNLEHYYDPDNWEF